MSRPGNKLPASGIRKVDGQVIIDETAPTTGQVLTASDGDNASWAAPDDPDAIHDNVAGEISLITEKVTPVSADLLLIEDSADSNSKKRVQIGNLPGGGGGGGSALQGSNVRASLSADQTSIALNAAIAFDTVDQEQGSRISLNTANGQFTVQPGTYILSGLVYLNHSTGFIRAYAWYDVTAGAEVPGSRHRNLSGSSSANETGGASTSRAVVSPTVTTIYELRFVDGSAGPNVESDYTVGEITELAIAAAGDYGTYLRGSLSTNQVDIAVDSAVSFDTEEASAGSGISLNTGNGQITVPANRRFELWASVFLEHSGVFAQEYAWYDVTAGAEVSGSRHRNRSSTAGAHEGSQHISKAIVEPSIDTTYELRRVTALLADTDSVDVLADFTVFEITELTSVTPFITDTGLNSNLWGPATRASSGDDNEFEESTELADYDAQTGGFTTAEGSATFTENTVDTYDTAYTSGTVIRTTLSPATRPSWLFMQVPSDSTGFIMSKPVTLGTNALILCRMKANLRNAVASDQDASIGFIFGYDNGANQIDTNGDAHGIINIQESDASAVSAQAMYSDDGSSTTIDVASTDMDQSGNVFNMVALHKVGNEYYMWVGSDSGNWLFFEQFTQATPFDRIGFLMSNSVSNDPAPQVFAVDFLRIIDTDQFLV